MMYKICFSITGGLWGKSWGISETRMARFISFFILYYFPYFYKWLEISRIKCLKKMLKHRLQATAYDRRVVKHIRLVGIVHIIDTVDLCLNNNRSLANGGGMLL